jgi:hypothetical protein
VTALFNHCLGRLASLGLACSAACVAGLAAPGFAAATTTLPRPAITVTESSSLRGKPRVLVHSLQVVTAPGARYLVACRACARTRPGRIVARSLHGGGREYRGANWVLTSGRALVIKVTAPGRLGWFFTIGINQAKRNPRLVYRHAGCLGLDGRPYPCPTGTQAPKPGDAVGTMTPAASLIPSTMILSGPSGIVTTGRTSSRIRRPFPAPCSSAT